MIARACRDHAYAHYLPVLLLSDWFLLIQIDMLGVVAGCPPRLFSSISPDKPPKRSLDEGYRSRLRYYTLIRLYRVEIGHVREPKEGNRTCLSSSKDRIMNDESFRGDRGARRSVRDCARSGDHFPKRYSDRGSPARTPKQNSHWSYLSCERG